MEKQEFESQFMGSRYVNLLTDSGFKIVYGDRKNKGLLIDLLNTILPEEAQVEDIIEYRDREQLKATSYSKGTRMDLLCRGKDGTDYIVEVQRERCDPFFKRVMYYASGVYRNNLDESEEYDVLTPVYVVGILDFKLEHEDKRQWDTDNLISHYEMMEKRTGELAPTVFSCNFVELSRFTKSAEECANYRDRLFYWFRHSGQLDRIPEFISRSPKVAELANACEKGSFSPEKKIEYERLMLNELDRINMVRQAERRGLANGREEGIAEGAAGKAAETAKNLKAKGIDSKIIAECTGLTAEQVAEL